MRRRRERTRDGSSWLLKSAETDCVDAIYDVNYIQMAIIYNRDAEADYIDSID